ncbi:hypothetical protein Ahy_B10g105088 [Arachis hypogaea]|uniref:Oxo-4-hydroxy-4-carboxy-5-ureidoimidazoline decarboxylase domain-containing protein n=1 Tax=Arachis hypogaea TaxID=3818 RepID=A0A444X772_ARAHY|nr:hypothetical protein Ahy_B10g105088 [Arachis hypogaea]
MEERDLFLCGSSISFCNAIEQVSPFSSLEHATSFARDFWFSRSPINSWLDAFSAHRNIGDTISIAHKEIRTELIQFRAKIFLSHQILEEVKACYENSLIVELEITSREEFILIERGLTRIWERLAWDRIQGTLEETRDIVQDSMQEEDVVPADSSDEVVSTGHNASMLTFDLNKTPKENEVF